MQRRRRISPKDDAKFYIDTRGDKVGLDIKYIDAFKGRGIFTSVPFEKGSFLLEYRGELISKHECERRQRLYHDRLKVFMFEFHFDGKLWCVDAAKEDGSLGRLVNDDHTNPNAKMKYLSVQGKPHLCLFAVRDISPGEEITYNYGDSDWPWRCKKSGGMTSEGQHHEGPSTSEPSKSSQEVPTSRWKKKASAGASVSMPKSFEKMMTESDRIETAESHLKQTSPDLDSPNRNEQMMTESGRIETAERHLKQTSPDLVPLNRVEQMMTESDRIETAESHLKQTSPDLDLLNRVEQMMTESDRIETAESHLKQTSPDLDSPNRNEQMMTESDRIETAESHLKQTSPDLDLLNRVEQMMTESGRIETAERHLKQTSPDLVPLNRVEQMMTESDRIETAESHLKQTSPDLRPLNRVEQMMTESDRIETAESHLKQTSPDLDSPNRNEQMMTESDRIETAESHLKQTSPDLDLLNRVEQMMTESGRIETAERHLKQTSPDLVPLNRVEQMMTESDRIETAERHLKQTSPDLDPLNRVEQMMTESGRVETAERHLKQTSPDLVPLNRVEQMMTESGRIETAERHLKQTSPDLVPLNRVEQMMTESDRIETAESHLKQTSPDLRPLNRVEQCQKHHLVCATVSSLDKCVECVGPVSSFKWLGYECKDCAGVWHKSCLIRIKNNLPNSLQEQQFSKVFGDVMQLDQENLPHSALDECMSDEEYIPNSESEDDDSDASVPIVHSQLKAGQSQVKPVMPHVGTSYGSDTNKSVVPSTSEGRLALEDHMATNAAETSVSLDYIKDSTKEKPNSEAKLHKQESTNVTIIKKNYCYVCGKPQSKISRHLKTHKTHAEIVHAFSLPEHSKERKILIEKMRNKGNFKHNTKVLQDGTGPLKVKRKPKAKVLAGKFIHCMYCQGMYVRKELWRHVRRCPCKPDNKDFDGEPGRTKVLGLAAVHASAFCQQISSGVWKLLSVMKQDEVASLIRNDLSIIQFAQSLYNKHGQDPTKYEYIRQKLREVGRLLLCLRTEFSIQNLEEAVKPVNFQRVVQAVKKVAGFDEEKHSYLTPSLALKLGHTLHKISDIVHCRGLMAEDEELIKSTDMFKKLYTAKWSELVSHSALNTLSDAKYNNPSTLPFTEDVQILHQHLEKTAENAFCNLKEKATPQNYAELAKVALAQLIVFNRRRAGEVSKMRLKDFLERDKTKLHEDVALGLSKTEQRLCNYFSRIEIMGKRGRKVAVLLTPSMVNALSLLASKRSECGICTTNVFLFARPKSISHYRGQDCLRVYASECGAKHPEHLRSTQLRKHVATLSQVLNLKNNELDQVADFLGHDIRVHRDFYRLPVPTTQLAKISKLLLAMEKGQLSGIQGKSLDEIEIEDEIALSDAEANDSESETDDGVTAATAATVSACGTNESVDATSVSTVFEQVHDLEDFGTVSPVSSTVNETAPSCKGKDAGPRRVTKKPWSKAEVAAVMRHFKGHICKGKLATKDECSHCKLVEGPVLTQRTVQNIRDFVRNRGVAAKRQSLSQEH